MILFFLLQDAKLSIPEDNNPKFSYQVYQSSKENKWWQIHVSFVTNVLARTGGEGKEQRLTAWTDW